MYDLTVKLIVGIGAVLLNALPLFAQQADTLPVENVVGQIKLELQAAALDNTEPNLAISYVDVSLATKTETDANGELKFTVPIYSDVSLEANAELASQATSRIEFTLTPNASTNTSTVESLGLLEAYDAIRSGIRAAVSSPPEMTMASVKYRTDFILTREAGGKVRFLFGSVGAGILTTQSSSITFYIDVGE